MSGEQHACPGGCGRLVDDRLFACRGCWFKLPSKLRHAIVEHHRAAPGSDALRDLQAFARDLLAGMKRTAPQ